MNIVRRNKIPLIYTSILYFCGFFLFLEWLYPIDRITDTSNMSVFIIYTLFCFIISLFQLKWWTSFILKGFGLLFIIQGLFFQESMLSKLWFSELFGEISLNVQVLFSQQWYELTPVFRSALFLLLIWLMSYLIHYWFVLVKRVFLFVVLTFVYLAVLDTFTVYDAGISMIRTFIIAFISLGMSNFFKEVQKESISFSWTKNNPIWLVPLISIVLFSSLIGYAAPKWEAQWPDPVPFFQGFTGNAGGSGGGTVRKVGYGEDDSRLGGSFIQDHAKVFQASVKEEHYWRIETKDVYTGKGWERSAPLDYQVQRGDAIAINTFSENVETEEIAAGINFSNNVGFDKLVYPYGINRVLSDEEAMHYLVDETSGVIRAQLDGSDHSLSEYSVTYANPSFDLNVLRESDAEDPREIKSHYTQLPSSLPERVEDLAEEITATADNRYDKALAIERYFGRNDYVYQISDVPVPGEEQDYVDQFLFESQLGYCDNYSTSMVVMLRTLDIPARWAKGFTAGEKVDEIKSEQDGYDVYEVTNSNAHSWVEVYFPESGWVPFEPTQGFSNLADFHLDTDREDDNDDESETTPPETEQPEREEPTIPEDNEQPDASGTASSKTTDMKINWWYVGAGLIGFMLIFMIIYRTRYRWQTALLGMKLRRRQDARTYQDAYHHVLKILHHNGLSKNPDQTLREYARRIDLRYGTHTMGELTDSYERILYNNDLDGIQIIELKQSWKNLIKRIIG